MKKRRSDYSQRGSTHTPSDPLLRGTQSQFYAEPWPSEAVRPSYSSYEPDLLSNLLEVEDGRAFEPTARAVSPLPRGFAVTGAGTLPRLISGAPSRLQTAPSAVASYFPATRVAPISPRHTIECIRRARRKEVLHALKKTGKGSGRGKKKRTRFSDIGC